MTPPRISITLRAELVLILVTVIWGGTFIVTQAGLGDISPVLLIALRFWIATVIVAVLWRERLKHVTPRVVRHAVLLGALLTAAYIAQTVGLQYTTAARSGFITYLFAIFIPPLQFFIARKAISAGNLLGLAIVFFGTYIFSSPAAGGLNFGDAVTFISAVTLALYIVYLDRYARESDPRALAILQFAVVAVAASIATAAFEHAVFVPTAALLWALFYLSVLGTAGALGLQTRFQKDTTPVRATIIFALEPVFAAGFGVVVGGQALSPAELTGGAIILGGLLLSELWAFSPWPRAVSGERRGSRTAPASRDH